MENHRMTHRMSFPCCLCPLADENQPDFVEAAIYMATDGPLAGKYVASCARDLCGYFGKPRPNCRLRGTRLSLFRFHFVVNLEQFCDNFSLHINTYPRRGMIVIDSRVFMNLLNHVLF